MKEIRDKLGRFLKGNSLYQDLQRNRLGQFTNKPIEPLTYESVVAKVDILLSSKKPPVKEYLVVSDDTELEPVVKVPDKSRKITFDFGGE